MNGIGAREKQVGRPFGREMLEIGQISPANVLIVSHTSNVTTVHCHLGADVIRRRKMSVVKDRSAAFTRQVSDLIKRRVFSHEMRCAVKLFSLLFSCWLSGFILMSRHVTHGPATGARCRSSSSGGYIAPLPLS